MRPPAPPVQETFAEDVDLFHPAVSSQNPSLRTLPTLTLQRFAEGKKITEDHLNSGSVNIPNGADVGVIPLGTGSAIPTKYRNGLSNVFQRRRFNLYRCSLLNPPSDPELGKYSVGGWRRYLGATHPSVWDR